MADKMMTQVHLDLAAARAAQIAEAYRRGQTWPGDVLIVWDAVREFRNR